MHRHAGWQCVVSRALRVSGPLDVEALRRSIEEVIRRHGSLRTRIVVSEGCAAQHTDSPVEYHLEVQRLVGSSGEGVETIARQSFERFSEAKPNLATGPLFRFKLLALSEELHWLLVSSHRLVADCSAIDQVAKEIWLIYGEYRHGRRSPLVGNAAQYGDYARWQERMREEWLGRHSGYWAARLAGAAPLVWPTYGNLPARPCSRLGTMSRWFEVDLSESIRAFARSARTLPANVMLAIYVAVIWRWCRQDDFILPLKIAGRHAEHRSIVGYFTQLLYLRMQVQQKQTFQELLRNVSNEFYRALSQQDYGRTATLVPEMLSGAFFQWITVSGDELHAISGAEGCAGLRIERLPMSEFGEGYTAMPPGLTDVQVTFFDTGRGIYLSGVYRADRFVHSTMMRFIDDIRLASIEFIGNAPEGSTISGPV
jgi:Condensation domain